MLLNTGIVIYWLWFMSSTHSVLKHRSHSVLSQVCMRIYRFPFFFKPIFSIRFCFAILSILIKIYFWETELYIFRNRDFIYWFNPLFNTQNFKSQKSLWYLTTWSITHFSGMHIIRKPDRSKSKELKQGTLGDIGVVTGLFIVRPNICHWPFCLIVYYRSPSNIPA